MIIHDEYRNKWEYHGDKSFVYVFFFFLWASLHTKKHGYRNPSSRIEDPLLETGFFSPRSFEQATYCTSNMTQKRKAMRWYLTRLFTFCCGINAPKNPSKLIFTTNKLLVGCSFASFPKVGTLQLALTYIFTDQFFPTEKRAPSTPEVHAGHLR